MNKILRKIVIINSFIVSYLIITKPAFAAIFYELNLRSDDFILPSTPFINFEVTPEDSNNDTWFETVLRINVGDPSLNNRFDVAEFQTTYDGEPLGITVNIGDSRTNNGFAGDGATQSNDAEMQIGTRLDLPQDTIFFEDLSIWGKDDTDRNIFPGGLLQTVPDIVSQGSKLNLTVKDEFLAWNNNEGISGNLNSPLLYALNGQADTEGSVNYDIFAAFNRTVASRSRIGLGVGEVTICLRSSSESSCFDSKPIPESTSTVFFLALGTIGASSILRKKKQGINNTL